MKVMFVYNMGEDVGSAQTILNYGRTARALGHEVTVYRRQGGPEVTSSLDATSADLVVFVLEWWLDLGYAGRLNLVRVMSMVPRERRIIINNDGMYNDLVEADGDYNHADAAGARARCELYDSISDRVFQPTLHPLRPNVCSFIFHGYDPSREMPFDFRRKDYGMLYVGNNWFRWRAMRRVLQAVHRQAVHRQAVHRVRDKVGDAAIVGYAWDPPADWLEADLRSKACHTDPGYLRKLGVRVMPAVPVGEVIATMSRGIFNPVLLRPLFNRLRLVTPRLFETPAANTIPLFDIDPVHVREIFGSRRWNCCCPASVRRKRSVML